MKKIPQICFIFRVKCDIDAKLFEAICSVRVVVTRLQVENCVSEVEEEIEKEKKAVLGLDETFDEVSSCSGEVVISSASQSVFCTSECSYNSDFIDDSQQSSEGYFHQNPYCSQKSICSNRGNGRVEVKKRKRVARIESEDSSEDELKKPLKRNRRVNRIESDESELSEFAN